MTSFVINKTLSLLRNNGFLSSILIYTHHNELSVRLRTLKENTLTKFYWTSSKSPKIVSLPCLLSRRHREQKKLFYVY